MENTLRKDREHKEHLAQQKAKLGEWDMIDDDEIDVDVIDKDDDRWW